MVCVVVWCLWHAVLCCAVWCGVVWCVADAVVDIATTNGMATPKAWGQDVTITVTMRSNAKAKS